MPFPTSFPRVGDSKEDLVNLDKAASLLVENRAVCGPWRMLETACPGGLGGEDSPESAAAWEGHDFEFYGTKLKLMRMFTHILPIPEC